MHSSCIKKTTTVIPPWNSPSNVSDISLNIHLTGVSVNKDKCINCCNIFSTNSKSLRNKRGCLVKENLRPDKLLCKNFHSESFATLIIKSRLRLIFCITGMLMKVHILLTEPLNCYTCYLSVHIVPKGCCYNPPEFSKSVSAGIQSNSTTVC